MNGLHPTAPEAQGVLSAEAGSLGSFKMRSQGGRWMIDSARHWFRLGAERMRP